MKTIRYFFEALLLGLLSLIFRILPLDNASAIGGWIGRSIGPNLAASRKARQHIKGALPDLSNDRVQEIIVGMWDNLGRVIAEYPHLRTIARERVAIEDDDKNRLDRYFEADSGCVLFSAHFGNWEILPGYLYEHYEVPLNLTYRAPNNPFVDKMLHKARTFNANIKALSKSKAGGIGIMKALKNKESVGILIDQKYNEGISVPFFGRAAMTNSLFIKMAQKTNASIVPVVTRRVKGAHFEAHCYEALSIDERSEVGIILECHGFLEQWITEHPEQWLWLHRRWPKGEFSDVS